MNLALTPHFNLSTQVTFRNETTGEFLFYLINFKVSSPGVLATINLETPVRRAACGVVHVENPLNRATNFTPECKCTDIKAPPQQVVPGQSKVDTKDKFHFDDKISIVEYT